jgi:ABC-2 type transport system ATP-binding protein
MNPVEIEHVSKFFGDAVALAGVTAAVPRHSIVGLIGRNGSGKSTLLRHMTGLLLPDAGQCVTLGVPAAKLGPAELARIGVVDQQAHFVDWMTGAQLMRYVASFYDTWDRALERDLTDLLEVDASARVGAMSPGHVQRLALVLASCHHPELLLLDEPLSDLDPIARRTVLRLLLDRFSRDDLTIVISSHMLRDIEPVVNRIMCLHEGRLVADADSDTLRERFAEWIVTSRAGSLPSAFDDPFVVSAQGDAHRARLLVRDVSATEAARFEAAHDAAIETRPLTLEQIFPVLTRQAPGQYRPRGAAEAGGVAR